MSEAELFLHGLMTVAQPWVKDVPRPDALETLPLGYKPAGPRKIIARATRIAAADGGCEARWTGRLRVVPIGGGLPIPYYLIGQRLGSRRMGGGGIAGGDKSAVITSQMVSMADKLCGGPVHVGPGHSRHDVALGRGRGLALAVAARPAESRARDDGRGDLVISGSCSMDRRLTSGAL